MLSKVWVWDPGSEIRDPGSGKNLFRIPDPGVKKAPDPGSGSATLKKSQAQRRKDSRGSHSGWIRIRNPKMNPDKGVHIKNPKSLRYKLILALFIHFTLECPYKLTKNPLMHIFCI
jgi:hypothetical protein